MRVSACDSRIAMPLCPQAKKLEAAGKAPPIRRHVDGASVPRVAYVLLLLVNLCHSNSRCTGYRKPAAYTTSPSKVSGHPEHLLHVSPAQNCEDRKARFQKQRLGANLEKNMSDRLLSLLEISAPLDGSWHWSQQQVSVHCRSADKGLELLRRISFGWFFGRSSLRLSDIVTARTCSRGLPVIGC